MSAASLFSSGDIVFKDMLFEGSKETPESSLEDKTKSILKGFRESMTVNWYKIQHSVANFKNKLSPEEVAEIFKSPKSLVYVNNYAKKSELKLYANASFNTSGFEVMAEHFGLYPEKETIKIDPVDDGKCFSAVAYFFNKTFEEDPKVAAKEFEEGIPYKAALYQGVYDNFCLRKSDAAMTKLLIEIISAYPKAKNKETFWKNAEALWRKSLDNSTLSIFEATKAFLTEGKDIRKDDYIAEIREKMKPRLLKGTFYGSVRSVTEHFTNKKIGQLDQLRFGYGLFGLELEVVHDNVSPKTLIEDLKNLKPGRYLIDTTVPGETYTHAIGIYVESDGSSYLIDANSAIGEIKKEDLGEALSKTFSKLYSIPLEGQKMAQNGYSLYRVSKSS